MTYRARPLIALTLLAGSAHADFNKSALEWVDIGIGIGGSIISGAARKVPPRPNDWRALKLPVLDTRYPEGHKKRKACDRELIELRYSAAMPQRGSALLIPGFMENAHAWDLAPERGISYARWLMHTKGLKVYMLHIRGVGKSCYPAKSNLDDMAIDDIPAALAEVSAREGRENLLVIGHSMGGIALQASLAGLDRCGEVNCFKAESATARQALVDGIAVEGSNVEFTLRDKEVPLRAGASFQKLLMLMPPLLFDRVAADTALAVSDGLDDLFDGTTGGNVTNAVREPVFQALFWRYFYSGPNVAPDVRELFKRRALDATSRGTIEQYSQAIRGPGMRATGGDKYSDKLGQITVPVAQAAFERDTFADWEYSRTDNFDRLGSAQKRYFAYPGEGHQDFMLNGAFHARQSELIDWLLQAAAAN